MFRRVTPSSPAETAATLQNTWHWICPFLPNDDRDTLLSFLPHDGLGLLAANLPISPPWPPFRRRHYGFGQASTSRSLISDRPSSALILHHVWTWLSPRDRVVVVRSDSRFREYASLRLHATQAPVWNLRQPRTEDPAAPPLRIPPARARDLSAALLRFDFRYPDLVRWLSGEYTNRHRDWATTFQSIDAKVAQARQPDPSLPPPDVPRAFRIFTEGAPLSGVFTASTKEVGQRITLGNHPAVQLNGPAVHKKFAKEEALSYHLPFLRVCVYFVPGLFLNLLQWVIQKGKGRICVDCTNGPDKQKSPNFHIPRPGRGDPDACPPIYYGNALTRYLVMLWRMRLTRPREDIILHADDIDAAFRRILYHPDLAPVFACLFDDLLLIPVGQVFGSRSAPSFFSLTSDLRAFLATTCDFPASPTGTLTPLAEELVIPDLPEAWNPDRDLVTAVCDQLYAALSPAELENFGHQTFVDDNGAAGFRDRVRRAIHQSCMAAYYLYGLPGTDRRPDCMNRDKWVSTARHIMRFLGFDIDSRLMTVTWPEEKRLALATVIDDILSILPKCQAPPATLASILGQIQSASMLAPWGMYIISGLRTTLHRAVARARLKGERFWKFGRVFVPKSARKDLATLAATLRDPAMTNLWSQPIAMLIPRSPTQEMYSDASLAGVGGWSPEFEVMWRVTQEDLIALGFPMRLLDVSTDPRRQASDPTHINPLEFLAIIINIWIACALSSTLRVPHTGFIVRLWCDNTTAISWFEKARTTQHPVIRAWARLTTSWLVTANSSPTRFDAEHISGEKNLCSDRLSRRLKNGQPRSWDSVTAECPPLRTCRHCLLPRKLFSALAATLGATSTEDTFEPTTISPTTLGLDILPLGSTLSAFQSSLSKH